MAGHIAGALPPSSYLLFLSWCPSFLPLMEEKKQKKIKASPRPGKFGRVRVRPLNVPARGESGFLHSGLGPAWWAYVIRPYRGTCIICRNVRRVSTSFSAGQRSKRLLRS